MDQLTLATAFKMTIALGAVLLTFGVAIMIARKFSGVGGAAGFFKRGAGRANKKPLEVLAFHSLGPGKSLYLINCLGRRVLVGATSTNINHVLNLDGDQLGADLEENFERSLEDSEPSEEKSDQKRNFGSRLKDISRV